jgi:hypothetical protein
MQDGTITTESSHGRMGSVGCTPTGVERILMSPKGGVNRRICTLIKIQPTVSTETGQTGFTQTEPTICESPLRVLAQTKLGVGLPQGFPRVSMKSLHTAQTHQRDRSGSTRYMLDREINQQARYI